MIDASRLKSVPTRPGCYLFKNANGETLYVGKAASLRTRLRSYFNSPNQQSVKNQVMLAQAVDFETIVTDSELEALILENNLIKDRHPKYNVMLRDDKQYPISVSRCRNRIRASLKSAARGRTAPRTLAPTPTRGH
jgi:excinuclease ABC subunit C